MMGAHVAHELDAVALLQADVGDHHVGIELLDGGPRIAGGFGFAAHGEVLFILHDAAQPLAHDRMIVDDQYAPALALAGIRPRLVNRRTYPWVRRGRHSKP